MTYIIFALSGFLIHAANLDGDGACKEILGKLGITPSQPTYAADHDNCELARGACRTYRDVYKQNCSEFTGLELQLETEFGQAISNATIPSKAIYSAATQIKNYCGGYIPRKSAQNDLCIRAFTDCAKLDVGTTNGAAIKCDQFEVTVAKYMKSTSGKEKDGVCRVASQLKDRVFNELNQRMDMCGAYGETSAASEGRSPFDGRNEALGQSDRVPASTQPTAADRIKNSNQFVEDVISEPEWVPGGNMSPEQIDANLDQTPTKIDYGSPNAPTEGRTRTDAELDALANNNLRMVDYAPPPKPMPSDESIFSWLKFW